MARYRVSRKATLGWDSDVPAGTILGVPAPKKSEAACFWPHEEQETGKKYPVAFSTLGLAEAAQESGILSFDIVDDKDPNSMVIECDFSPLKDCIASITKGKLAVRKL